MKNIFSWILSIAFAIGWLSGCGADPAELTQIVVTVDSDLSVPQEIDRVTIDLSGAEADTGSADLTKQALPRSLGLVHSSGPLGPLTIRVVGWLGAARVVESSVSTSFVAGKTSRMHVVLQAVCSGVSCQNGETCSAGACVPISSDGDAGTPRDAGAGFSDGAVQDAAGPDAQTDGSAGSDSGVGADGSTPGGAPPVCSIELPAMSDSYQAGSRFNVKGSCTDPESGTVTLGLSWRSNRDGKLASTAMASVSLTTLGSHSITLCAKDPVNSSAEGCAAVSVDAVQLAQPTATITAVVQGQTMRSPFASTAPIVFQGRGTGAGTSLAWTDTTQGPFGTGLTASLGSPAVGKHLVTLTVTDRDNRSATTTTTFAVLAPGQSALVQPYGAANVSLGAVTSLMEGPAGIAYAASASSGLYRVDTANVQGSATLVVAQPPLLGLVNDAFRDVSSGLAYFATAKGLTVCSYASVSGLSSTCSSFAGGSLPSDNALSVLRVPGPGSNDKLLIGTASGLLSADAAAGANTGTVKLDGRVVRAMLSDTLATWVASDQGLYRYTALTGVAIRVAMDGAPATSLTALASGATSVVWVGSSNGLGRYVPLTDTWTAWRTTAGLVNNQINSLAVEHQTIGGVTRDIVWIATNGGVSRFDAKQETFVSFTAVDGLPSDKVNKVLVLADGSKLFATDAGLARYIGP